MDNTLILVDYDNIFITLKNNYRDYRNPNIMYDVITKIKEKYKTDNILSCRLFADFQKVQISEEGYDILRKAHVEIEHVFNGRNASDVVLMINCMKYMMQYPHIDKIILVSSDSDLVPIFREVQLLNKKLEVLYFEINTSEEHVNHMVETNITHCSIENLLGLNVCKTCKDLNEFYTYKTSDKVYFEGLLQCVNDAIKDMYDKYKRLDASGNVIAVGATNINSISHYLKDNNLCPERDLWNNTSDAYYNILDMLQAQNILYSYTYTINGKPFKTLLLSQSYLTTEGYTISNLIKESDFTV